MKKFNSYEDARLAEAYAKLEFTGTYHLAYRDIPAIISEHVKGRKTLDFGCGTGRSTRFLKSFGFDAVGVDIAEAMLKIASETDPDGRYCLIEDGDLSRFNSNSYNLVLSAFTFDNIPEIAKRVKILREMARLLKKDGRMINLVSSPDIYLNEWVSFSTRDFPENKYAKSGDKVKIINTDIEDNRPVVDVVWTDEDYRELFITSGLELVETYKPLAHESEPFQWVNETKIAPWVIHVLKKAGNPPLRETC